MRKPVRYHHLFSDLLSSRLQETLLAGEIQNLHRRRAMAGAE
jgi:ATP/maltotriose-dependent transcriptional regulator MalT